MQKQLAFVLARAQVPTDWLRTPPPPTTSSNIEVSAEGEDEELELSEDLLNALSNTNLSTHFKAFGKELGAEGAKSLEDIYKTHLEHSSA